MKNEFYNKVETVFRYSNSNNELFDAFGDALKNKINDFELYKILLANPSLSVDEIKMFSEKLLKDMPMNTYHILMWVAKIFESRSSGFVDFDETIRYYERAINTRPVEYEPHLNLLNIFNYEVETEQNKKILHLVENGIGRVISKSKIYYALADLHKRLGDTKTSSKYVALAEKAAVNERE